MIEFDSVIDGKIDSRHIGHELYRTFVYRTMTLR